jgi:hypothetical protein
MNTPFSAGPAALGYLYQAQHALYALLKEERAEAKVVIEGLDDVSVEGDDQIELQQLKHHINREATLTNASSDLWKTIRVWSTSLKQRQWQVSDVKLSLITTAQAPDGSVGALLRDDDNRDEEEAYQQLLTTATTSISDSLKSAFDAFKALTVLERKLLIKAIVIEDRAPQIVELEPKIKQWLRWGPPVDKIDQIYNLLMGWWYNKVAMHLLSKSTQPISQIELRLQVEEMVTQLQRNSLPIEFEDAMPQDDYFAAQKNKNFYRQLDHIKIGTVRMRHAVLDYYRAFEQRTKWVKDTLLVDADLHKYERRLHEEWERYYAELAEEVEYADQFDEPEVCVKFGRQMFSWMNKVKMPIRPSLPPGNEYVARGSYHLLADKDQPPVYWHPHFLKELEQALQDAAQ